MAKLLNSLLEDFKSHVNTVEGKEQAFKILTMIDKKKYFGISEGLICSYDPNKIAKTVKKEFELEDWQYRVTKTENNTTSINIVVPDDYDRIEYLKRILNDRFGWYYTRKFKWKTYDVLNFRAKFSDNEMAQEEVREHPILWHVTTYRNYQKILKQGFVPKSKNSMFEYPEKVHFLLGKLSIKDAISCYKTISLASKHKKEDWVILKVDVRKDNGDIPRFYWDPDYIGGLFTYENISKDKIELVKVIHSTEDISKKEHQELIERELSKFDTGSHIRRMTYKDLIDNTIVL